MDSNKDGRVVSPGVLPGVCVWFTGLSGGGKSTLTSALVPMLNENGRVVTILDVIPLLGKHWCERSSEGKLLRKAFVAKEVVRHGGIAICVTVSARNETREQARSIIGTDHFVEVFVDVPREVALARKAKRTKKPPLLKRMRHSVRRLKNWMPGYSPKSYERPRSPDLIINTTKVTPEEGAQAIFGVLCDRGFLLAPSNQNSHRVKVRAGE